MIKNSRTYTYNTSSWRTERQCSSVGKNGIKYTACATIPMFPDLAPDNSRTERSMSVTCQESTKVFYNRCSNVVVSGKPQSEWHATSMWAKWVYGAALDCYIAWWVLDCRVVWDMALARSVVALFTIYWECLQLQWIPGKSQCIIWANHFPKDFFSLLAQP